MSFVLNKTKTEEKLTSCLEVYQPALREVVYFGVAQALVDWLEKDSKNTPFNELNVNFTFKIKQYLSKIVNLTIVDINYLESICNNLFKLSHLAFEESDSVSGRNTFFSFIGLNKFISNGTVKNIDKNFDLFSRSYFNTKMYLMELDNAKDGINQIQIAVTVS